MSIKHSIPLIAGLLSSALALTGCGKTQQAAEAESTAMPASPAASNAPAAASSGNVVVAPISRIASAPGIDPMNASTVPPMPAAARASAADSAAAPR